MQCRTWSVHLETISTVFVTVTIICQLMYLVSEGCIWVAGWEDSLPLFEAEQRCLEVFARLLSRQREMLWKFEGVWNYEGVFVL
jgi:hypothetical protein